jgi:Tol biopolymer transport system component
VDSSQARNVVQGCVEKDDRTQPGLRVVNPKSFFFEVKPISGGNGYPSPTLLAPGEDVNFEASTSDPSPLTLEAEMTQKSGWYLVVDMVITMLPGANEFGIQGHQVACITERLSDVSYFASAVESLVVGHDGAAAAESISKFMLDGDAVGRFITAADNCNFGPAPTWSLEGIKQIGGAVSTIMSATDYIANYFAGNTSAQLSFAWNKSVDNMLGYLISNNTGKRLEVINVDGTGRRDLLPNSAISEFSWANNGKKIAYVEKITLGSKDASQIGVIDLLSGTASAVVKPEATPFTLLGTYYSFHDIQWSHDDQTLFFVASDGRAQGDTIRYLNPVNEAGNQVNLPSQGSLWSLDVSPNDNSLVFRKWWNGIPGDSLEIISADGAKAATILQPDSGRMIFSPRWSPDGSQIAFQDMSEIFIINSDGSNMKQIADEASFTSLQVPYVAISAISWSPDGKWITLAADPKSTNENDIWMVSTSNNAVVNLSNSQDYDETSPVWSPDGIWIAFVRNKNTIWLYDTSTKNMKIIFEESSSSSIEKLIWKP